MPDIVEPSIDVECDSDFENDYAVHDELNNRADNAQDLREEAEEDLIEDSEENTDSKEKDSEEPRLKGGAHSLAEEEEESEDELLLTTKTNTRLQDEIDTTKATSKPNGKYFYFHLNHPQYKTHYATMLSDELSFVPNFVGGPIPRRDGGGSREEYCLTMLTFFKPWRSGHDLRSDKKILWHDAFHAYPFTTHQQQIMDNFMIKYECNDARDDFAAQRKQKEKEQNSIPLV